MLHHMAFIKELVDVLNGVQGKGQTAEVLKQEGVCGGGLGLKIMWLVTPGNPCHRQPVAATLFNVGCVGKPQERHFSDQGPV